VADLSKDGDARAKVLKDFQNSNVWHDDFITNVEKRYKSYRGILERRSEAASWTSKLHPQYAYAAIETIVSNLIDDRLEFDVQPRIRLTSPQEIQNAIIGAKAMKLLLDYENELDHLDEKQREFALQASIVGISPGKVYWDYHVDSKGNAVRDDPCFSVVDARDFFWDESGTSVETCRWVMHRCWESMENLKAMAKAGIYKNVDRIGISDDAAEERITLSSYEDQLLKRNRTKGLIEVLEYWTDDRVISIADRSILLRNDPNPFEHGQKPFVTASTMPQPFQMGGISDVELIAHLQDAAWTMLNQRIDNVKLLNNNIIIMRSDVDDPDDYEFGPGERWLVDDVQQISTLQQSEMPAQVSLEAERIIKGDMLDISGGSGMATQALPDSGTATSQSIAQTVAQRRSQMKKQQMMYAWKRVIQMKASLLQQFVDDTRLVPIIGRDGVEGFHAIEPQHLQAVNPIITLRPVSESLLRQERKAEGNAMAQMAGQLAPVAQASGTTLHMDKFVEHWLDMNDIPDPGAYFSKAAPQPQQAPGGPPQGGGQNPQGSAPTADNAIPPVSPQGGITNPSLSAGSLSPSSPASLSPVAAIQQLMASRGAGRSG
jgi:hypothetical protein